MPVSLVRVFLLFMPSSNLLNRIYVDPTKVPLRWLLVIPFVLLTVGSTALVGYLSYRSGQQATENLANQLLEQTSERVRDRLSNYLRTPQQLVAANRLAAEQGTLNLNDPEQLRQHLWQQMVLNPSIPATAFWSETKSILGYGRVLSKFEEDIATKLTGRSIPVGTLYFSSTHPFQRQYYLVDAQGNPQTLVYTVKGDFRTAQWYREAKTMRQQQWTSVTISLIAPMLQITAVAPVLDATGNRQGLFSSNYLLAEVSTFLNSLQFSPSGQIFILERSGNLIATSVASEAAGMRLVNGKPERLAAIESQNQQTREVAKKLLQQFGNFVIIKDSQRLRLTVKEQQQFVQVTPYRDTYGLDWLVVTVIPDSDFMAEIDAQNSRTVWLCLGTLVITIALGLLVSKWITDPLHRLNRSAHAIAQNQFDQGVPVTGVGEVRQLSQSFRQMAEQLRLSFQLRTDYEQELEQQVVTRTTELAQVRDLREAIFNESTDAIFLVEPPPTTRILDCNQRAVDLFEVESKAELIGIQGASLQKQPYTDEELAEIGAELEQKGFWSREIEYVTKTGKCFWGNLAAKPIIVSGQAMHLVRLTDITNRKQIELALQAKTEELDRFFSVALDLLCIADTDGYFRRLNQQWETTLGYSLQELEGIRFLDFVHPGDLDSTLNEISILADQQISLNFVNRYRCRDGSYRWIEWRSFPVGNLIYAAARDITDRKQTEIVLRQSEQKFRGAFDTISTGMALVSPAGGFIEVNAALCEMLGYTEAELLRLKLEDIEHPDDRPTHTNWIEPIFSGELSTYQDEMRFLTKHGQVVWGLMNLAVMRDGHANPLFLIVQIANISDRKQAEEQLRRTQQWLNQYSRQSPSTIYSVVLEPDGRVWFEYLSSAVEAMHEVSLPQVLEDPQILFNQIHPDDSARYWQAATKSAEDLTLFSHEWRIITSSGKLKWLQGNSQPERRSNGAVVWHGVIQDISDRHQLDAMKDEFVSVVSHELRTPLTSIRGSLGILDTGVLQDEPETAQRMLKVALKNADRLVRLVNDILDLQRLESGRAALVRETCEVSSLMEQAIEAVQEIANQATVTLSWTPLSASIQVAPDAIVQTLTNLLSNAIKFSPPEGTVWLKAEVIDPQQKEQDNGNLTAAASFQPDPAIPYLRFSITDQGRGIPSDKLESIFGRFQQVDASDARQKGGTGLGLAICKNIVQQHQGQIWVESTLGLGSTFYFTLPGVIEG